MSLRETKDEQNGPFIRNDQAQVIYADKVIQLHFSPNTVKLELGTEVEAGMFKQTATVVLPTIGFIQALDLFNSITKDEESHDSIIKNIENIKKYLIKNKNK